MQQTECWSLGEGVNACGRKLTFLFALFLGKSYYVVIAFCGYSGFESASLNWNTIKSERNRRDS